MELVETVLKAMVHLVEEVVAQDALCRQPGKPLKKSRQGPIDEDRSTTIPSPPVQSLGYEVRLFGRNQLHRERQVELGQVEGQGIQSLGFKPGQNLGLGPQPLG